MADPARQGGHALQNTTVAGLGAGSGFRFAQWAVHPTWPPPDPVIAVAIAWLTPLAHMAGRGIYRRIARWSGEPEEEAAAAPPDRNRGGPTPAAAPPQT